MTATHCNILRHTATHCNTLQHTATNCNTLQHTRSTNALTVSTPSSKSPVSHNFTYKYM